MSRPPIDAGMALGTVRLLGVPIDDQGLQVRALARPSLPAVGPKGRPDDIDLMLGLGGDQEVGIDIAAVEEVRARQQITLGQFVVDGGPHDTIRGDGGRGNHLSHQIRRAWITGLGEVQLVAHPMGIAFIAGAGLQVVGRGHAYRRGRWLVPGAPAECFESRHGTAVILLQPDPPQCLQGGEIPEA
jgi:hypothetical protein